MPKYGEITKFIPEKNSNRGGIQPANPNSDHAYNAFLNGIDPRGSSPKSAAICHELACSADNRFREFLRLLTHPTYKRSGLATIARHCGISLKEFNEWAKKAYNQWSLAIALERGPQVTTGIADHACARDTKCDRCDGFGWVYVQDDLDPKQVKGLKKMGERQIRACPDCEGKGTVSRPGDPHSIDKILEMTGMTGKRSPAVQINQNFGGMGMDAASERLAAITFDVGAEEESGGTIDVQPESGD